MSNEIFIPGNVASIKRGRIWTGKKLVYSKASTKYIKLSKPFWEENKEPFQKLIKGYSFPLTVGFHFVRATKRRFDWINLVQTCQDMMVKYEWIEDDNIHIILPFPYKVDGEFVTYDKENNGVLIKPFIYYGTKNCNN